MPHPNPSLHIATAEIPDSEGMFNSLLASISKGVAFATGNSVADRAPEPDLSAGAAEFDPCFDHVTAVRRCLNESSSGCQEMFDDLSRCRRRFLPRAQPTSAQFFTR